MAVARTVHTPWGQRGIKAETAMLGKMSGYDELAAAIAWSSGSTGQNTTS